MRCPMCKNNYPDLIDTCPFCGGEGLSEEESGESKISDFDRILEQIVKEYGGLEIFSGENQSRLKKALMSLNPSKERDLLLVANLKHIPQELYLTKEKPEKEQMFAFYKCISYLRDLELSLSICMKITGPLHKIFKLGFENYGMPKINRDFCRVDDTFGNYPIVQIGNLWWFAENLSIADRYQGTAAPWFTGRLYNRTEALNNVPQGWRLPTRKDFEHLCSCIRAYRFNLKRSLKGKSDLWCDRAETDAFGFNAGPLEWDNDAKECFLALWTSSESDDGDYPYTFFQISDDSEPSFFTATAEAYCAVRYVKDVEE